MSGWISVEERLPPMDTEVLGWTADKRREVVMRWDPGDGGGWLWLVPDPRPGITSVAVSHWHPLTDAPTSERVWRCTTCGCSDVEGTAWIDLNSGEDTRSEPPLDVHWCNDCEDNTGVELVQAGSDDELKLLDGTREVREHRRASEKETAR